MRWRQHEQPSQPSSPEERPATAAELVRLEEFAKDVWRRVKTDQIESGFEAHMIGEVARISKHETPALWGALEISYLPSNDTWYVAKELGQPALETEASAGAAIVRRKRIIYPLSVGQHVVGMVDLCRMDGEEYIPQKTYGENDLGELSASTANSLLNELAALVHHPSAA